MAAQTITIVAGEPVTINGVTVTLDRTGKLTEGETVRVTAVVIVDDGKA